MTKPPIKAPTSHRRKPQGKTVTVWITFELLAAAERVANAHALSRSEAVCWLMELGLERLPKPPPTIG